MTDAIIKETVDFESIQTTSVYQHNSLSSTDVNKLVTSLGVGKNFISCNFDLTLQLVSGYADTMYAVLTPGVCVQDYTVINFQDSMEADDLIYIKLYTATNLPGANTSIFIGPQYYHGTYGDGINAKPTYAKILKSTSLTVTPHFVPWYKLSFLSGFSSVDDTSNILIERVIPHLKYNYVGQPTEQYQTSPEGLSVYGDDRIVDDGIIWAIIL